jgi:hypothetical protein
MHEATRRADIIDFFWERRRRERNRDSDSIAELALDKCEAMFQQRNWREFAHWHAIYCLARSASQRAHCCDNDISQSVANVFSVHDAQVSTVQNLADLRNGAFRMGAAFHQFLWHRPGGPAISPELTTGKSNVDKRPTNELRLGGKATLST